MMISSTSYLVLGAVFVALTLSRIRNLCFKRSARVAIWDKEVGIGNRIGKLAMAGLLVLVAIGVFHFTSVVALPSEMTRYHAKAVFCVMFSAWALLEIALCWSISEGLRKGSLSRRLPFLGAVIVCIGVVACLIPLVPKSLRYPAEADCVILELPVRGEWLARHAGASGITNGHHPDHPYAIDVLKLGPDGQLREGRAKAISDFYGYDEPVYAPADGRVAKVVDGLEGELIGNCVSIDIGNGRYVLFVHFKNGGIAVAEGQRVRAGKLIGRVGNSGGRSGLLHLHMQVQNKATFDPGRSATYPFRFRRMLRKRWLLWEEVDNGYLLRNDRFSD